MNSVDYLLKPIDEDELRHAPQTEVVVSREKVQAFKAWLDR